MEAPMLIDMHIHLNFGGFTEEHFIERAEKGETDMFAVSSLDGGYYPNPVDICNSNAWTHQLMQRLPKHILGFAYVNPVHGEQAISELRHCVEDWGFSGVKLWVATFADDPRVDPIVETAIEYDLPLLIHCWVKVAGNLPFESKPMHLGRLAQRFPEAKIIMAHLGGDWEYGLKVARDHPNIWVDTSGSMAEMDTIEKLVENIGAERLLFGTDNSDLSYCKGKIIGADLTAEQREQIFWRSAHELMKLDRR
jgi:predicted TIM-barrel fold metal-dependent hydrolase